MTPATENFIQNDGGRASAGFKGNAADCVCRSIAIASGRGYASVYNDLAVGNAGQRQTKRAKKRGRTARNGIHTQRKWFKDYMLRLRFRWVPTMRIGQGCKVHLRAKELPAGRLVVMLSGHATAVINGVIHDTYDPSRDGTRCVYGYYILEA
jgi:hypothetical protein